MVPADSPDRDDNDEPPTVKTPVEARSGVISGHIITVLIVGTVLAVILLGIAWAIVGA